MNQTENRDLFYEAAEKWELDFVEKYGEKFKIIINPSKEITKFAPDLYLLEQSMSADLKLFKVPFYTSLDVFGIPPRYCWTFNPSDLFDYSVKYPDSFGIFVWKVFEASSKFGISIKKEEAVYCTTLFHLKTLIKKTGKIHKYIRRMNDTNGNSYGSFGVDLRNLTLLNTKTKTNELEKD